MRIECPLCYTQLSEKGCSYNPTSGAMVSVAHCYDCGETVLQDQDTGKTIISGGDEG